MGVDRGVQHDRGLLRENRQQSLDQEVGAFDIDREGLVESRFAPALDRAEFRDTGIDEEDIERAESVLYRFGNPSLTSDIAGIGLDDENLVAEFRAGGVDAFGAAAGDGDASAFGDELAGGFKADTAGAAGYQGCFICKASHCPIPLDIWDDDGIMREEGRRDNPLFSAEIINLQRIIA